MTKTHVRDPRDIWWRGRAREAGFESAEAAAAALGLQRYRLDQIYRAAAKELVDDFSRISVLPSDLRKQLGARFKPSSLALEREVTSKDGQTTKFLFALVDGKEVEVVLMRHRGERMTACISSQ